MLSMKAQVDVVCCKSVGTDLSMLDIEDFITEICQLKKEVASLEAKLRERGDKLNREDVEQVSVRVTDGTEAQDSVWSVRDQRSRDTQDSELSLTLLCYTDAQDHESTDQTSDCNAGEQQMLQTPLKTCSVKLVDCRNLIESRGEETTAEKEQHRDEEEEGDDENNGDDDDEDDYAENNDDVDDGDFVPSDKNADSSSDGETASTSKEQRTKKSFSCATCGKTFSKQCHLTRHARKKKHTEQNNFTCKICNISFPTFKEKTLHSKEHSVKKEFRCEQCGKDFFTTLNNMRAHIKPHKEKSLQCNECSKFFRTKQDLSNHKRIHTGEKPYKCPDLSSHMRIHTGEKPYQCPHCEKSFSQGSNLKTHLLTHSNENPYQCSECGKPFISSASLKLHQKKHFDKLYQCPHCEMSFSLRSDLMNHLLTHSNENPYQCSECGKPFISSASLKLHQKMHSDDKPYQCSHCEKGFHLSTHCKTHERIHTGEKPYLGKLTAIKYVSGRQKRHFPSARE
ncbi:zinc finger protein 37-like [Sinocyclocheilus anshuiensis]|uniref:zinc finger protein 37-like n=1 Tax=Sinocyclocheilus anshuiensis TaxID=1608454 RepID=UPI0007BA1107|nr:PREDICTED: zinc finger protein 37-like [Sinocyclocheilus anshuiensis]